MTFCSPPIRLAITCVAVITANAMFFVLPDLLGHYPRTGLLAEVAVFQRFVPELVGWGICCWLATRTERTSIPTYIFLGFLALLNLILDKLYILITFRDIPEFLYPIIYQQVCSFSYDYVSIMVLCRLFGIGLSAVESTNPTPSLLSKGHVILATFILALMMALGRWIAHHEGQLFPMRVDRFDFLEQMSGMMKACGMATLFCGVLWWLRSSRWPWLSLIGIAFWLATRIADFAVTYHMHGHLLLKEPSFGKQLLVWQPLMALFDLAVIPILGMFGYRFWFAAVQSKTKSQEAFRRIFDEPKIKTDWHLSTEVEGLDYPA